MSVRGIEVSDIQGRVDWSAVAAGTIAFGVTQATEGSEDIAKTFARNWNSLKAVGLVRGASHCWQPQADGRSQADRFLELVRLEPGDLPPILKVLPGDGIDAEEILAWLHRVESATQRSPLLQIAPDFWNYVEWREALLRFPLWIVERSLTSTPKLPKGFQDWWFWQYGDDYRIAGIPTDVPASWFNSCQNGAMGDRHHLLQQRLKQHKFHAQDQPNSFGKPTQTAVQQFQRSLNLREDGIVGPQTWAHLIATPSTSAAIQPLTTPLTETIQLTRVGQYYQAVPQQTQALEWLQNQLNPETIAQFARIWRNQPLATHPSIRLVDAAVYYQGSTHQVQAFNWLQTQIAPETLEQFSEKWRAAPPPTIDLIEAARYYQGLPAQAQALDWLQARVSATVLTEFARLWRNKPTTSSTSIRLVDAATYYKAEPYQDKALIWLQRQISAAALAEFAQQWRSAPPLPMRLENVPQYYQGLPYQDAALHWLQDQIPRQTFEEFARKWRG